MKAVESNFVKFLQGTKQFIIPIYQRTYSWTRAQCEQLWNDIYKTATNPNIPGHFIGSVVYIEKGIYQISSVSQLLVIDGQQRLTTISLLLNALSKAFERLEKTPDKTRRKILNYYLINSEEAGDLRHKLILTQSDKETLSAIIEEGEPPKDQSSRIIENHKYFEELISKSNIDLNELLTGISKLFIVDVSLDRNYDDPQLIFESLNSTGLDLSQADLIRNYILMGQEPPEQERLYKEFWYPMEQDFGEYSGYFDGFMRDYLTIKTGNIPRISDVYKEFKKYVASINSSIYEIVKDIRTFSKYFVKIAFQKSDDKELNDIFKDIETLKVDVSYPLLLELFNDFENNLLKRDEFIEMLKIIESYVFRRAITGIPTNSLNKTFATYTKTLDKKNYLESFKAETLLKDFYRRFPTDEEFKRELCIKDVYNFRNRNYLLKKLENYDRKEKVEVEEYTIEHILPQNKQMSKEWQKDLGDKWKEVQEKCLHTIGNLTLTGYNPELSDRPFLQKKEMKGGFKDSPLRLNRYLAKLDNWNEETINLRANELSDLALKIWRYVDLPSGILDKYRKKEDEPRGKVYSIEQFSNYLKGDNLLLFEALKKRILNLDSSVRLEFKKLYIAFKTLTNFVDIVPQKSRLRLTLNMDFEEIIDPQNICKNVTDLGRWGNGNVQVALSKTEEIDYIMTLVEQSFRKQSELSEA